MRLTKTAFQMRNTASFFFLLLSSLLFVACSTQSNRPIVMGLELPDGIYARIETNKGNILTRLEYEKVPLTVANFVGLSEGTLPNAIRAEGESYYDGITFHRVVDNFMIQGGDPKTLPGGNPAEYGTGGPGYAFKDEITIELRHNLPGTLSMANSGPATNGSQFFITHTPTPHLDGRHTVFGYVSRGLETVNAIRQNDTIRHISIFRVGKEAENFDANKIFEEFR